MTTDDAPGPRAVPADEVLQFDQAEFSAPPAFLICGGCGQPIRDAYYEIQGKVVCECCRDRIVARFAGGSEPARFLRASLFGVGAAVAGAAVFVVVLLLTHSYVGWLAILVGYMVGVAIRKGTRYRGGLRYQLLAVALTYTAIVCWPVPFHLLLLMRAGKPIAVSLLPILAEAYALPFRAGAKNFMGLVIIGFALFQAWRMNPKIELPISGPFQVSGTGPTIAEAPAHA